MKAISTRELLSRLLSQPTAPFREGLVRAEIARLLAYAGVPHFLDSAGNLIAGANNFREMRDGKFRIALMAHMDHPGFLLGRKLAPKTYQCHWYGGAPWEGMKGSRVRVHDTVSSAQAVSGTILSVKESDPSSQRAGRSFSVRFERDLEGLSANAFGGFDFPGCSFRGDRVWTRAADDIAGCAIALGAMLDQEHQRKPNRRGLLAFFTRAEEIGFVGCMDLLLRKELPRDLWVLSLEASKELPGARLGKGPVLRVGDKVSLFDSDFSSLLLEIARKLEKAGDFRFQRRLMDGGTCEATPLMLMGYTVSALAVPLRNYHNNGAGGCPAAEVISLSDADQARRLCFEVSRLLRSRPKWRQRRLEEISNYHRTHVRQLRKTVRLQGDSRP